jgi:hypothetical protein
VLLIKLEPISQPVAFPGRRVVLMALPKEAIWQYELSSLWLVRQYGLDVLRQWLLRRQSAESNKQLVNHGPIALAICK